MFVLAACAVCVGFGLVVTSLLVPVEGGGAVTDAHGAMADAEVPPHGRNFGDSHVEDLVCEPLLGDVEDLVSEPLLGPCRRSGL